MKLLYLSCHAILEYDELKLFEELGIDYFSLGSYVNPKVPVDAIRPPLSHTPDEWCMNNAPDRRQIPKEFFDRFDTIMIMHKPEWIYNNWEKMKHKRVIWRSIGQSTPTIEKRMKKFRREGLEIVRYSPREAYLKEYIGMDAIIRFYKDPDEFKNWEGAGNLVATISQNMKHRGKYCNYDAFIKIAEGFNAKIYGPNNKQSGALDGGYMTYEKMKRAYRDARVYIYTGTIPASYTLNFIEAWMTGTPIVAIGPKYYNVDGHNPQLYEIPDLIGNNINGYMSDNIEHCRSYVDALLKNKKLANNISSCGRQRAIELFGKEVIKEDWRRFLNI